MTKFCKGGGGGDCVFLKRTIHSGQPLCMTRFFKGGGGGGDYVFCRAVFSRVCTPSTNVELTRLVEAGRRGVVASLFYSFI